VEFTPRQGQYLAFIHACTLVNGRPPAQADMQRFFRLTPPAVHQMLFTLKKAGLISRTPGAARAIAIQVDRSQLPALQPGCAQTAKFTVQGGPAPSRLYRQQRCPCRVVCLQGRHRAGPGDAPALDHHRAVGDPGGEVQVLLGQQHGKPGGLELWMAAAIA